MESYESALYSEFNDTAVETLTLITAGGFTLRQLQDVRASAASLTEAIDEKIKEYHQQVKDSLNELDGSRATAVSLLTGIPLEDFEKYGGFPDEHGNSQK